MHRIELCIIKSPLSTVLNIGKFITIKSLHYSAGCKLGKLVMNLIKCFFQNSVAHL